MDIARRYLRALATTAGFDQGLLDRPGTVVVGGTARQGSRSVALYEAGEHAVVWCDPVLCDQLVPLSSDRECTNAAEVSALLQPVGVDLRAVGDMRLLIDPTSQERTRPRGYMHRSLRSDSDEHVELIRAFVERNSHDDVHEAGLDDLDNFDERAINVLTPSTTRQSARVVAYASAADWAWDADFCDIGVLVEPAHRRKGLGVYLVGLTVAELVGQGRLPLYRHDHNNTGSKRIADTFGFTRVTTVSYFAPY